MSHYRITQTFSDWEAAYIAGLIDGEGTITLQRKHAKENRRLAISISSTEIQLLEFVKSKSGVGTITTKKKYSERHAKSFTYAVYSRQALDLLVQVHPYLLTYKRKRSELILSRYVALTPRNGKYTIQQKADRAIFEHEVLSMKPGVIAEPLVDYNHGL